MEISSLYKRFNGRMALVFLGITVIFSALYWTGEMYIQLILLVFNMGMAFVILMWEKEKRKEELLSRTNFSNDERWSKIKKEIERIDMKLEKTYDGSKRKVLLSHRQFLSNELRRVEWSIKEANYNASFNALRGNLKKLDQQSLEQKREFDEGAKEYSKEKEILEKLLCSAEDVIKSEPRISLLVALKPISNEFKAHYNAIRKKDKYSVMLSDYWVAWAMILSIMNGVQIDPSIAKYSSKEFAPKLNKFIASVRCLDLEEPRPVQEDFHGQLSV